MSDDLRHWTATYAKSPMRTMSRVVQLNAGMLKESLDMAHMALLSARETIKPFIDSGDIKPDVKFNGGDPCLLCAVCHRMVRLHVDPAAVTKSEMCSGGMGCDVPDPIEERIAALRTKVIRP